MPGGPDSHLLLFSVAWQSPSCLPKFGTDKTTPNTQNCCFHTDFSGQGGLPGSCRQKMRCRILGCGFEFRTEKPHPTPELALFTRISGGKAAFPEVADKMRCGILGCGFRVSNEKTHPTPEIALFTRISGGKAAFPEVAHKMRCGILGCGF